MFKYFSEYFCSFDNKNQPEQWHKAATENGCKNKWSHITGTVLIDKLLLQKDYSCKIAFVQPVNK